ncbi:MAG: aminotransferase class IV [Oscillospiraceae bacterium]|nr:aminotransferase class IV [Oscillospiraceae bacterium]
MQQLGYYNGSFGPLEDMTVPMNDRGCYFGDGVYDAAYSRNHVIFTLNEHVDRFFRSAEMIGIRLRQTKEELKAILNDMLRRLEPGEYFVYWQVTRGTAVRVHAFPESDPPPNLWIMIKPGAVLPLDMKVKLRTVEDTRHLRCNIKTLNLLPNVLASEAAARAGASEAIFHRGDRVTEGARSNVHILRDGVFRTAPADNFILPGVARAHLIKACGALGIPVDESPFTVDGMMAADEILISSAGSLGHAAEEIDGLSVGGKAPELLEKLHKYLWNEFLEETKS